MFTYNFSTREKFLLAVLLVVGFVVAWYQFVVVNFQNQTASLDAEIANVQDELVIDQSRAMSLAHMKKTVADYEKQGYAPVRLPAYDNTQNLMAYLNGVLSVSSEYSMSFDNAELDQKDKTVHRTGTISYSTGTYKEAREIAQNIAHGPYPCKIEALGIADTATQRGRATNTAAAFSSSLQITFYEKSVVNTDLSKNIDGVEEETSID